MSARGKNAGPGARSAGVLGVVAALLLVALGFGCKTRLSHYDREWTYAAYRRDSAECWDRYNREKREGGAPTPWKRCMVAKGYELSHGWAFQSRWKGN